MPCDATGPELARSIGENALAPVDDRVTLDGSIIFSHACDPVEAVRRRVSASGQIGAKCNAQLRGVGKIAGRREDRFHAAALFAWPTHAA
ncbi:MAG: hypothetical protein JO172_01145 [Hyphomicrobiales bacterium]|nr:hypothetical protein [Hyphomicrobiales bacterium]